MQRHGDTEHEPPNRIDFRQIYYNFITSHQTGTLRTEFDSLRRTRQLAWALTYPGNQPPFDGRIVDNIWQLRDALWLIENRFRISALLGVFDALLQAWDTPNAGVLRAFVRRHLIGYEGRRTSVQRLRANMMWYCEQNGATQLAMNLLRTQVQLSDVWSYLNLPDHTHGYRYFGAVGEAYVALNRPLDRESVADIVNFVEMHRDDRTNRAIVSRTIERLGIDASEDLRQPVQSYVLQRTGQDPRRRWWGCALAPWVSDKAQDKSLRRWITKEDLRYLL